MKVTENNNRLHIINKQMRKYLMIIIININYLKQL